MVLERPLAPPVYSLLPKPLISPSSMAESVLIYRRIISAAATLQEKSSALVENVSSVVFPQTEPPNLSIPICHSVLDLPSVPSILHSLLDHGVDNQAAEKVSLAFDRAISRLRKEIETSFQKAWSQILNTRRHSSMLPLEDLLYQLRATHASVFSRKAGDWANEVRQRAVAQQELYREKFSSASSSETAGRLDTIRPSFNNVSGFFLVHLRLLTYHIGLYTGPGGLFCGRAIPISSRQSISRQKIGDDI